MSKSPAVSFKHVVAFLTALVAVALVAACQPAGVETPAPPTAPPTLASSPAGTVVAAATVVPAVTATAPVASPTAALASPTVPPAPPATATAPAAPSPTLQSPPQATPVAERVTLVLGDEGSAVEVEAELAIDRAQRSLGLMHRETLPEGTGMLFVFPEDTETGFWMANTLVPLSIAFIAADGTILGLDDMQPLTTDVHPPPAPYRYALEVPQGFFARHGVEAGSTVRYRDGAALRPLADLPATSRASW